MMYTLDSSRSAEKKTSEGCVGLLGCRGMKAHTQTHRHTDTQTHRHTDTHRHTQTHTDTPVMTLSLSLLRYTMRPLSNVSRYDAVCV